MKWENSIKKLGEGKRTEKSSFMDSNDREGEEMEHKSCLEPLLTPIVSNLAQENRR